MKNLFDRLNEIKDPSKESSVDDEARIELLLFMKSRIDMLQSKNDLKNKVQKILGDRLDNIINGATDDQIDPYTLIRLLEVLNKTDTDESANLLGVLKQQIILQQNNFGPQGGLPPVPPSPAPTGDNDKEDVKTARAFMNIIKKVAADKTQEKDVTPSEVQ